MASATTIPTAESTAAKDTLFPVPDICPQDLPICSWSDSEKARHAENMTDAELVGHVESRLRLVGENLRNLVPYLREARDRYAQPGRRFPLPGQPSFSEWVRQTLGISPRHVRRLLAAERESTDRSPEAALEQTPKPAKRNEALWQACRLAHAVLGLDEPDESDPSGSLSQAAVAALAYKFLNTVHRKNIPVIVRLRKLQPGDFRGLYAIVVQCLDAQIDEAFASLNQLQRSEAVRLFVQLITERYDGDDKPGMGA